MIEEFGRDLRMEDVEMEPGPGEVPVEVRASGICGRDLVVWRGGFRNLRPPLIPGHEVFGELDGRPVGVFGAITCGTCRYCRSGKENLCESLTFLGEGRPGGYAEVVDVPLGNVFDLPDSDYPRYAAAACPLATAIHSSRIAGIREGERVLVTGAGGGVGIHAIQYLRAIGAKVISATSEGKVDVVSRYSDQVVTGREFSRDVREVDAVLEIVGSDTVNESLRSLRREGRLVLVGNVGGRSIELVRPAMSIMREHAILGSAAFTKSEYLEAVRMIHEGMIEPHYRTYPLEGVNDAYRDVAGGRIVGRAVLVP
ncbi:Alcohol dehydrogenase [Conexivisphaera calida]|uniref:Alcohol dehydrogenase n=1 Tax=Conexivisphaera calida TaxID=1874277 RepID=A0A4P2VDA5_9ARCH|nr:Alcohol dehydrogenase [Conexivisphaera calida]